MEMGPRDKLSQAFVHEMRKGRTIKGPYGEVVHLDVRHLGEKKINEKIPFVRELAYHYAGIDPVHEPIPVRPVVHYMMGGVHTDAHGATPVPGLYAAGEVACVSMNGANRLGSNSLPELLVFGRRAGQAAAAFAGTHRSVDGQALSAQVVDEENRLSREFLRKDGGTERVATLRTEMTRTMEAGCGIYRDAASLRETTDRLSVLRDRFSHLALDDRSLEFNTDLVAALELDFMLDVAQAVAQSALARTESRGSHQRTDFPKRDDTRFLKHSLAHRTGGAPRIDYLDVVITRWPPAERVYGR